MDVQIRWLNRPDIEKVLETERECFDTPWTEEDFLCCLRQSNAIGIVVDSENEVIGFMIYELSRDKIKIANIAVHPKHQGKGYGSKMICRLIEKLSKQRRKVITLNIRETNLDAQLFFQSQGFWATGVIRNAYENTDEDAYVMQYILRELREPVESGNRISQYFAEDT